MPAAQPKANQTQAQPQVNQTQVQPQVNQTQAQPVQGKQVPVGVKIISVLYYIGAVFGIIFGILFIVGAGFIGSVAEQIPFIEFLGAGLFIVAGIIMIAFGVLGFFVGRGLWKARNWARIVAIIFAILGLLMAIIGMVQGNIVGNVLNFVVQAVIGGYLLFSKSVKAAFT